MKQFFTMNKLFTNKYPLSKTLRFELKPLGNTLDNINKKGLITQDEERAEQYKKAKKIIDEYHKEFIEESLSGLELEEELLKDYRESYLFFSKELQEQDDNKERLISLQKELREAVVKSFSDHDKYASIDKKELINEHLPQWLSENRERFSEMKRNGEAINVDDDLNVMAYFKKFTTYFTGFHENRKNIYTKDEHSTGIAYRIVHQNLPKFIDNIKVFNKIKENYSDLYQQLQETEKNLSQLTDSKSLDMIFSLEHFNACLSQSGIDRFNYLIGGVFSNEKDKIQGLNEIINLYKQQLVKSGKKDESRKIPKFTVLFKQILSDRNNLSFQLDLIDSDEGLLETLNQFDQAMKKQSLQEDGRAQTLISNISSLFSELAEFDLNKIWLEKSKLSNISAVLFKNYAFIRNALEEHYTKNIESDQKVGSSKKEEEREKRKDKFLTQGFISIESLNQIIENYKETLDSKETIAKSSLIDYFRDGVIQDGITKKDKYLYDEIANYSEAIQPILSLEKISRREEITPKIKEWLDSYQDLLHFMKPLILKESATEEKDELFYERLTQYYLELESISPLYNKVRSYLTKKPYNIDKIKLNFENSTLLNGWDANKEPDNTSIILKKDGLFYLAIMDSKHNKLFKDLPITSSEDLYEKVHYKLLPGANKMLPKVFLSKKGIENYHPSLTLLENYKKGTHKKGADFNLDDCHNLIDFFKRCLNQHPEWNEFKFTFSPTKQYLDISYFYREVEQQGYKITYQMIDSEWINQLVDEGKLYLFQIYNKDFSSYSKGTKNLHTIYWEMLFDEENLKNVVYKLNGQAEIFHRKASIPRKITHAKNQTLNNKNELNPKKRSLFTYDLIKDKRFTEDKFQFHVPITMNFKATGNASINRDVQAYLKDNSDVNIIGIDRGERHLLYLSIINQQGEILEQRSLNTITGEYNTKESNAVKIETDYHSKLAGSEVKRDEARKSWSVIENIKELKAGYLSQVVHQLSTLMLEHNAIIVLEDLNFGFKRGRFHVEKQVYQKFEKALIDKLNYLVIKSKSADQIGGALNALQLSNKFESFQKLGKQSGFIFYTQASHTSKIDPLTGFINYLYPQYKNKEKSKKFFSQFEKIFYNQEKNYFEFHLDYAQFDETKDKNIEAPQKKWVLCTHGAERYIWRRELNNNKGGYQSINITEELKKLFESYEINYGNEINLTSQITVQEDADFYKSLTFHLKLLMALRYSTDNVDFMLSPVANAQGIFYDSREAQAQKESGLKPKLPIDADANGAYHIALKGLWTLLQINETEEGKNPNLAISNNEWLKFAQNKPFLK